MVSGNLNQCFVDLDEPMADARSELVCRRAT
jgi:hypothetical protein